MLQFYYHFESNAWSTKDNGWLIKMYKEPSRQKYISVERPPTTEYSPDFCHLIFTPGISYPGVASLDDEPRADPSDILEFFDYYSDDHYEYYEALIDNKRTGLSTNSRLGGYPTEIQRYPGWRKNDGSTINVFLQLDSEDKAGFMWGDSGLVYFGLDPESQKIEFALQCA